MYKLLVRPLLFLFKPEFIHNFVIQVLKAIRFIPGLKSFICYCYKVNYPSLEKTLFGLKFPNPVGLAAGFDKDAEVFRSMKSFGFGFIEIGTITPEPQSGNIKPRLFRLIKDKALINRMGFNNNGAMYARSKLLKRPVNLIIGANIGKNKWTSNDTAAEDYIKCFNLLYPVADYFVINVSSPNTPGLRNLQEKEPLKEILKKLIEVNNTKVKPKPILLKIAPDLSFEQLDDIIEIVTDTKAYGIIATNTTIDREGLSYKKEYIEAIGSGGLSGVPLRKKSTEIIRYITQKSMNRIPVIGSGGIMNPEDATEKIEAGASLIQIYTGFIYEGPSIIKNICKEISKKK